MSLFGKTRLFGTLVFVLVLGFKPLAAQSGKGSGNAGNSGTIATPAISDSEHLPNVLLTGYVVTADGLPPPERVAIQRVCGTDIVRLGFTDRKGFFSLQLRETISALQDASDSTRDVYVTRSINPQMVDSPAIQPMGTVPAMGGGMGVAANCELRGQLSGFQSTAVMVVVTPSLQAVNLGTIVLLKVQEQGSTVSATSMNAPKRARKAYDTAIAHLRKQKLTEAQPELERAVNLYPRYAAAWAKLGWLHEQQNRLDQAHAAFSQAQAADDRFVPAYMGLASVAIRQSKWAEAEGFSARATELDGVDFPLGFYYNGVANLELGRLDKAEKAARMAERLDVRHSLPQIKLLRGTILARKRDYAGAIEELTLYLNSAPATAKLESVRQQLAALEKLSRSTEQPSERGASLSPAEVAALGAEAQLATNQEKLAEASRLSVMAAPDNWAPPDIDEAVPPVRPNVPCAVHEVLRAASMRVQELMDSLQQFSATERIEHVRVDKKGDARRPEAATFKYVAQIREVKPGQLEVEEYRSGTALSQSFPAKMITTGMAAHALLLHPSVIDDLAVTCEGLGSVEGKPAWQLHFVQRPNRPHRFRQYRTQKGWFNVEMKGRVWIAADSYQVMRMETDLAKPIEEIALHKDHVIIDYRAVPFPKRNVQLWLPETTDLYVDLNGQRSHRRHSFRDFELFWVDIGEKTKNPANPGE